MAFSETLTIAPAERLNLALCAGVLALALAFASPVFAVSFAIGAVLEAINFRALLRATAHVFDGRLQGSRPWMAIFGLRFALLATGMFVAIDAGAHPVGLVLGLSTVIPAVVVSAWRQPPPDTGSALATEVPPPDDASWDEWNPWLARPRAPRQEEDEL